MPNKTHLKLDLTGHVCTRIGPLVLSCIHAYTWRGLFTSEHGTENTAAAVFYIFIFFIVLHDVFLIRSSEEPEVSPRSSVAVNCIFI